MTTLNLSYPITLQELGNIPPADLLSQLRAYCSKGQPLHQDSLMAIVLKMTALSRDLNLRQSERDEAAHMATALANAALKSYGSASDFCHQLKEGINRIMSEPVAA